MWLKAERQKILREHIITLPEKPELLKFWRKDDIPRSTLPLLLDIFLRNAPKYSAIVLIKNPRGWHQYGSNVAAPVFKEIADNIYARDINLHLANGREKICIAGSFSCDPWRKSTGADHALQ